MAGVTAVHSQTSPNNVKSFITFLSRNEIYKKEKPYGATFPVDHIDGATATNHVFDTHAILIQDVRGLDVDMELDVNGFSFLKAKTSLQPDEASDTNTLPMKKYTEEIIAILQDKFPEYVEIRLMDFQVRKRAPEFPNDSVISEFAQPAMLPHVDFSVDGAFMRLRDVFPNASEVYEERDFDLINVWKVLKGPNDDWPLALCDYSSIDWEDDTTANDAVHQHRLGENRLLHHHDKHRWFYLSHMEVDDLIVIRNTDANGKRPCAFHAAFNNLNPSGHSAPRESVELRVIAFRT